MKGKILNAQEVQAILNGSKVMFREVIKDQPTDLRQRFYTSISTGMHIFFDPDDISNATKYFKRPYEVGQEIFVKESFTPDGVYEDPRRNYCEIRCTDYKANYDKYEDEWCKWKPAPHMKQERSRISLRIKDIRVERLQEISEVDCLKEGCYFAEAYFRSFEYPLKKIFSFSKNELLEEGGLYDYKKVFSKNWNTTHKKPKEKFEANPWVWVIEFDINNKSE